MRINKIIILFISYVLSSQAIAEYKISPYVGFGYQLSHVNDTSSFSNPDLSATYYKYLPNNFHNLNLFAGFNLQNTDFGFEISYFKSNLENKTDTNTGITWAAKSELFPPTAFGITDEARLRVLNFDITYSKKIPNYDEFNMLAIAGVSRVFFDSTVSPLEEGTVLTTISDNRIGYGLDLGLGFEKTLVQNLSVRAMAKYTTVNNLDLINKLYSCNLGFKYQF